MLTGPPIALPHELTWNKIENLFAKIHVFTWNKIETNILA